MVFFEIFENLDEEDEILCANGFLTGRTFFQSPQHRARARRMVAKYLNPSCLKKFDEKTSVIPMGIDCDEIDEIRKTRQTGDKIVLNYSGKMYNFVNYEESFKIMDNIFRARNNVKVQVVTPSLSIKHLEPQYSHFEIHYGQNREMFLEKIKNAHIFINNSLWQDFSMTTVEQAYMGLIPILPNTDWAKYIVGEKYPYLFNNVIEAQNYMLMCVDSYEEDYNEIVPELRERIKQMFDSKGIAELLYREMQQAVKDEMEKFEFTATNYDFLKRILEVVPERFTMEHVFNGFQHLSDYNLDIREDKGTNSTSKLLFYRMLKMMGCEDTYESEQPIFIKPKEITPFEKLKVKT